jgi:serine/threonine protein kinase
MAKLEETKQFGRYEVVAELGRGAMGVVYKARDPQIDRMVAVKTVSMWGQEPEEEKEFRLRFLNEAQAAGRLHHSGIVSVFDVGENPENQDPYIVLEYVAGESLNRILARKKKLELITALQFAEEIAEALDYAHSQGVVHRDIKPANILVTEAGHAKIADFGIAKLNLAHFTIPGRVLGTPAYMAPEQLSGEGADGRSDLFSLGVILYAMVTGHSPFQGNSATTVCYKVANREPIAVTALDMTLPPQLDAVIERAIAKDPDNRYQRGADFANDLRQLQQYYKPASTTTSLRAMENPGTRSGALTASTPLPPAGFAQVEKIVRFILFKAPIRDLVLAGATVVLLVVLAAQSRQWLPSPKATRNDASIAALASAPTTNSESAVPRPTPEATPSKAEPIAAVAATPAPPRVAKRKAQPAPKSVPSESGFATLELAIQHQFKDATLFLWVDDKLELTRPLHGGSQKKLVVFNGIRGTQSETLRIPAGNHVLRLRALSSDQTADLSRTIAGEFIAGGGKSLQVTFDRHNRVMRLAWE